MKIAISTGFFTERDMDVNSGHVTKVRYKKLASGKFSACIRGFVTIFLEIQGNELDLKWVSYDGKTNNEIEV